MTGAAYTEQDFDYAGAQIHLTPEVIDARIKQIWQKEFKGARLLGFQGNMPPTIQKVKEEGFQGEVDWLSEKGGYNQTDMKWTKIPKVIRPYGVSFDILTEEFKYQQLSTIARKIALNTYMMVKFEDAVIYNDILASIPETSTVPGSDWTITKDATGVTAGDPIADFGKGRRIVRRATKGAVTPDTIVMSEMAFEYLGKFDKIQNRLYYAPPGAEGGYVRTAQIPMLMGMEVMLDDQVDPLDTGRVALGKKGPMLGYLAEVEPLSTLYAEGRAAFHPEIQWRYWERARREPIIEGGETWVLLEGIFGEDGLP